MGSLLPQVLPPLTTGQRTSIPLRSILNAEEGCEPAEEHQPRTPRSEVELVRADKTVIQRSQFLFINTHNASKPNARLRQDQKVINAHVQHISHRQRRAAAIDRLKRIVRLCPQCAQSKPNGRVNDLECESSPSSSASESSPASPRISDGPLRRPPQKKAHVAQLCAQCGATLKPTGGSRSDLDVSKENIEAVSPITPDMASSKEQPSPLTLFVVDQPASFLDSGLLDPFTTSAVPLNLEMNGVLVHFIRVIVGGMYPVRSQAAAQTEWSFQICLAEPSAMFAVLAVSATDLQARTGRLSNGSIETTLVEGDLSHREMPAYLNYKMKAIKAVNEKMTSTAAAAEIVTIVVVMSCLLLESITGNQRELSRHVTELQKLLTLRGGYHGLPDVVVSAALPLSYMSAAMTRSFPLSPPLSPLAAASTSTCDTILSNTDPQLKRIGTRLLEADITTLFDESLVQAFHDLREVILYRESFHNQECVLPKIEVEYFSVKAYETLHRALSIPFQFPRATSPQQEPCRLALLVFWHANYAIHLPNSGIFRSLTGQLKSALEQSDPQSLWQPHYRLFIWVMFLGAYISVGQREHPWFTMYLARAARQRSLNSSTDLKAVLQPFFYLDRIYRKGLQDIWDEASILMDAL